MRYNHGLREPSTQLVPPIVWQAEGHMPFGNFGACWAMTCLNSTYIAFSLIPTFTIPNIAIIFSNMLAGGCVTCARFGITAVNRTSIRKKLNLKVRGI